MRRLWLGVVTTATGLALACSAAHASVDLLSAAHIRFDGAAANDRAGSSVAAAGDVNGDGRGDIIVGANHAASNALTLSGSAYVIYGSATLSSIDLAALTPSQGFRIDGEDHNQAGTSVAPVGDLNDDGFDDIAVGAENASNNARSSSGSAFVIYGAMTHGTIELATLSPTQGFRIDGVAENDTFGSVVADAGDVNDDGIGDLIASAGSANDAAGIAYVIYGSRTEANLDLATLTSARGFAMVGGATNDTVGNSLAGAGDVNGDGFADVIVGAFGTTVDGRANAGAAYVIYGAATHTTVSLGALPSNQGYRIDGAAASDAAGSTVAAPGDVNGDGRADLVVAASGASNHGRASSGSVYVIYGTAAPSAIDLAALPATKGFRIDGAAAGDATGASTATVAGIGDINDDGRVDLLVGARGASFNARAGSGTAYVIHGGAPTAPMDLAALTPAQGFRIDGAAAGDQTGGAVASAGDLDGDGYDDLLIGASRAGNNARSQSGSVHVLLSQPTYPRPAVSYRDLVFGGVGDPFSTAPTALTVVPGTTSFTVSPALPAGLSIDQTTGVISGTPAAGAVLPYTVTVADATGRASATITLSILNAHGLPGATGSPGLTGAAGAAGAPGPTGATVTKIAFVVFAVSPAKAVRTGRSVTVRYAITDAASITLTVKAKGAKAVRVATKRVTKAGVGSITWNGRLSGKKARPGTYTLTITAVRDGQAKSSTVTVRVKR